MPPDDNAQPTSGDALGGVRVHRYVNGTDPGGLARYLPTATFRPDSLNGVDAEPGVWLPQVRAATLEAVVAAAREFRRPSPRVQKRPTWA